MARLLILGSGGRLGAALEAAYSAQHEVIGLNRKALDLADFQQITDTIGAQTFDVAINCAAVTNVDWCETHRAEAFAVNADAARVIAEACLKKSARLIHVSTDYVLSGEKETPYLESDPANPISVYGESKLAGEIAALEVSPENLAIRVSWVFGPHRDSFIDNMLRRALTEETISAVSDKYSTPSYTLDLAEMLEPFLIKQPIGGILHLCNEGACSWQEYAQYALDIGHQAGLPFLAKTVDPIPLASLKAFIAQRPRNTVMATDRLTAETGRQPRPWKEAVAEYVHSIAARFPAAA